MTNKEVASVLYEIAVLLDLCGESPFKGRAYENVARQIEQLQEDLADLVAQKRLREVKGVGTALEEKLVELVTTDRLAYHEELRAKFPSTLFELFLIPGLGAKRIKVLYDKLGADSLEKLENICKADQLNGLKGFGPKMCEKILTGIEFARQHQGQFYFDKAWLEAVALVDYLSEEKSIKRISIAGSLRRCKEVVKDIDIIASSAKHTAVMERFLAYPGIDRITGKGETKSSAVLIGGIASDLRVVSDKQFPYALAHFTGSKEHNVVMRQRAKTHGWKLNEYGLFEENDKLIACKDEAAIYEKLDLPYIPPELREDMGEFDAAKLPKLLEMQDLRGVVHCHSTYSDGKNTLEDMAKAVKALGYEYLVISDHSQTAAYAGGLRPEKIVAQHVEIGKLNQQWQDFRIIKGIESDIRINGDLDYPDDILATFEVVIASVHQKLEMTEAEATARVIKAVENPYTTILGHPTGRLLLSRNGFPLDFDKVFDACLANGVALEINANCRRLDLDWRHVRRARDKGCKFSIGPDAHTVDALDHVRYGVGIARKGWLECGDVVNCLPLDTFLDWAKR